MKIFDKIITIDKLNQIPFGEPIGIIYSHNFGLPANEIIPYIISLGGETSLTFATDLLTEEKSIILNDYIDNATEIYSPTLLEAVLNLYKISKNVNFTLLDSSFLTNEELYIIYNNLEDKIKPIEQYISAIWYLMFFIVKNKESDLRKLKTIYPADNIRKEETPPIIYNILRSKDFFDLYRYGVIDNPIYYTDLFESKHEILEKILFSKKNYLLETLLSFKLLNTVPN